MANRYHVHIQGGRTTVTLDKILSALMALRLGQIPETEAAHAAVRSWLQQQIDSDRFMSRGRLSQTLQMAAALAVADPALSQQYATWCRDQTTSRRS